MTTTTGVRFDFAPVEERITNGDPLSTQRIAEAIGVNRRTVARYRRHGLSVMTADAVANAIGHHPSDVWPGWDRCDGHL